MIFGDNDLSEILKIIRIDKSITPSINTMEVDVPGKPGTLFQKRKLGIRRILVNAEVRDDRKNNISLDDVYRDLSSMLLGNNVPEKLFLPSEPDKYYNAIVSEISDIETFRNFGVFDCVFVCHDPLAYSEEIIKEEDIDGKDLVNEGTYTSLGIIEITLETPVDHLKVTLDNTGEYLYLDRSIEEGKTISIDLITEKITENDILVTDDLSFESDFFEIPIGSFRILVNEGTGSLAYRTRWL